MRCLNNKKKNKGFPQPPLTARGKLGQEKNILVLVIGPVDFDANKKKCGLQNKYDTEKNTQSGIFFICQSSASTFHLLYELLT